MNERTDVAHRDANGIKWKVQEQWTRGSKGFALTHRVFAEGIPLQALTRRLPFGCTGGRLRDCREQAEAAMVEWVRQGLSLGEMRPMDIRKHRKAA